VEDLPGDAHRRRSELEGLPGVSHDTFDHTSAIRPIERVTGVVNPDITAWRRQTVGDFTSVFGSVPNGRFPRLPGTKAQLEAAENEVIQFQLPPIPGASQTFPVQPPGHKPVRDGAASTVGVI
jgi:phospholipase C